MMRPVASFTLHAILAAALAALATTSAAAGEARLTLGGTAAGEGGHIDVQSYSWGETGSGSGLGGWAKMDGLAVDFDRTEQPRPTRGDTAMKGSAIGQSAPAGTPQTVTFSRGRISAIPKAEVATARDAGSGQAGGKRQPEPPAQGSLTVRASLHGCATGTAYSSAELQTSAARYELKDVVIASCAADSFSLSYAGVTTR
jgi:hypothetical protein